MKKLTIALCFLSTVAFSQTRITDLDPNKNLTVVTTRYGKPITSVKEDSLIVRIKALENQSEFYYQGMMESDRKFQQLSKRIYFLEKKYLESIKKSKSQ